MSFSISPSDKVSPNDMSFAHGIDHMYILAIEQLQMKISKKKKKKRLDNKFYISELNLIYTKLPNLNNYFNLKKKKKTEYHSN